jgi:hypothetical protein
MGMSGKDPFQPTSMVDKVELDNLRSFDTMLGRSE